MGKSIPSPPDPPDPYATGRAQTTTNVDTAIANTWLQNANERGPLGSVSYNQTGSRTLSSPFFDKEGNPVYDKTWVSDPNGSETRNAVAATFDPETGAMIDPGSPGERGRYDYAQRMVNRDVPTFEKITTLSPEQQRLYDQQVQAGGKLNDLAIGQIDRLVNTMSQPVNFNGSPALVTNINPDRYTDAIMSRLRPELERGRASMDQQLANQGLTMGSEAWRNAQDAFGRQENDARMQALLQGQGYALNEGGFQNQARQQSIQETLAQRNQPINEISALLGGGQVSMPQFPAFRAGQVANTPVGEYAYRGYEQESRNWATQAQMQAQASGGMFSLGGSLIGGLFGLSDRRMKVDIRLLRRRADGLGIYAWRYAWDAPNVTRIGLMADEVAATYPQAVSRVGGFLSVAYKRAA